MDDNELTLGTWRCLHVSKNAACVCDRLKWGCARSRGRRCLGCWTAPCGCSPHLSSRRGWVVLMLLSTTSATSNDDEDNDDDGEQVARQPPWRQRQLRLHLRIRTFAAGAAFKDHRRFFALNCITVLYKRSYQTYIKPEVYVRISQLNLLQITTTTSNPSLGRSGTPTPTRMKILERLGRGIVGR